MTVETGRKTNNPSRQRIGLQPFYEAFRWIRPDKDRNEQSLTPIARAWFSFLSKPNHQGSGNETRRTWEPKDRTFTAGGP